jgi:hypothetical protein
VHCRHWAATTATCWFDMCIMRVAACFVPNTPYVCPPKAPAGVLHFACLHCAHTYQNCLWWCMM